MKRKGKVFIPTALFNYHGGPFFTKWLRDLKADQLPDGNVPIVIPAVVAGAGSAAWGGCGHYHSLGSLSNLRRSTPAF